MAFALLIVMIILIFALSFNDNIYSKYYYFDANGTTPIHKKALQAYNKYAYLGNASGIYADKAKTIISEASDKILNWCGVNNSTHSVIFNSGASEGNNHIFRAFAQLPNNPHFIISTIEHKTSIECCKWLAETRQISITWVKPNIYGIIETEKVINAIKPNTVLISIMAANNELGSKNPIYEIAKVARKNGIQFHSDSVQLIGKEPIYLKEGPSIITGSFHKFHGPQGLGFIVFEKCVNKYLQKCPHIFGSQFKGLRGGTENVPAIASASTAMDITFSNRRKKNKLMVDKKNKILNGLLNEFELLDINNLPLVKDIKGVGTVGRFGLFVNIPEKIGIILMGDNTVDNTLSVSFVKTSQIKDKFCNIILQRDLLDEKVIISIGSACSTGKPSHVLQELNLPHFVNAGVVRISISDETTWFEVNQLIHKLIKCVKKQIY